MTQGKQQRQLAVLAAAVLIATAVWLHYGRGARLKSGFTENGEYTLIPVSADNIGDSFRSWQDPQKAEYIPSGRNIFVIGRLPADSKKKQSKNDHFRRIGPVEPIVEKPVLPMVFFGSGVIPVGGPRQGFLKDNNGEDVHIVSEGDLLLNHCRILHIGNERLDVEDINTGLKGSTRPEAPPAV